MWFQQYRQKALAEMISECSILDPQNWFWNYKIHEVTKYWPVLLMAGMPSRYPCRNPRREAMPRK
jgi:hypothetical protein